MPLYRYTKDFPSVFTDLINGIDGVVVHKANGKDVPVPSTVELFPGDTVETQHPYAHGLLAVVEPAPMPVNATTVAPIAVDVPVTAPVPAPTVEPQPVPAVPALPDVVPALPVADPASPASPTNPVALAPPAAEPVAALAAPVAPAAPVDPNAAQTF